jgi:hypothetical protein
LRHQAHQEQLVRPPSYGGKELLQLLIQAAKKGVYTHQEREHISLSLLPVLLLLLLLLLTELVIKQGARCALSESTPNVRRAAHLNCWEHLPSHNPFPLRRSERAFGECSGHSLLECAVFECRVRVPPI